MILTATIASQAPIIIAFYVHSIRSLKECRKVISFCSGFKCLTQCKNAEEKNKVFFNNCSRKVSKNSDLDLDSDTAHDQSDAGSISVTGFILIAPPDERNNTYEFYLLSPPNISNFPVSRSTSAHTGALACLSNHRGLRHEGATRGPGTCSTTIRDYGKLVASNCERDAAL